MKRIITFLLAAALGLGLAGCAAGETAKEPEGELSAPVVAAEPVLVSQMAPVELPDPAPVWDGVEDATFSLLQDTYPAGTEELTLVIDNKSGGELRWGTWEVYEKYVDGEWRRLEYPEDTGFRDVAFILQPDHVRTQTLRGLKLLPALDEGLYRVTGSTVFMGDERFESWQVSFRVTADAQPEPDYALYVSSQPIPTVDGCAVLDRLPGYFVNTTGEEAQVLLIPHLEKLGGDGEWAEVPFKEGIGFCGTPDPLSPEGKAWSWEISMLWGTLEDGRYRLSCEAGAGFDTEGTASGEFTIFTPENNVGLPLAGQE